jgi:hypothetical protein
MDESTSGQERMNEKHQIGFQIGVLQRLANHGGYGEHGDEEGDQ